MFRSHEDQVKTRAQLMRDELGESFDHAMRAAGHAAGGVKAASSQVAPAAGKFKEVASQRWDATLAAFNEAADQAEKQSKKARKEVRKEMRKRRGKQARQQRRWPRLAGLLAAGAVVGAIGAMVMRRRRQQEWAEYDPNEALEAVGATAAADAAAGVGEAADIAAGELPEENPSGGYGATGSAASETDELVTRPGWNNSRG